MDPRDELKRWRGEMSLATAGKLIKCDPSLLRKIESKVPEQNRKPGLELAIRIRNVVGIPLEAWGRADEPDVTPDPASSDSGTHPAVPDEKLEAAGQA